MIGICTDSNSQLPAEFVVRYAVEVVPVTVTVGGHDFLEGVDLDADQFYEMMEAEPRPTVSTSQPSPGQFAAAYDSLLHRGCDEILSIHVAAATSRILNSARLATRSLPVPVRLVDSGTAGFGVSCCVWAAAEAIARGATLDEAVRVAELLAPQIGSVFVLDATRLVRSETEVAVMTLHDGKVEVVSNVDTMVDAVETMARTVVGWGARLKAAVGRGDKSVEPLATALADAITESANVGELIRYRIGPSVGVYSGPGAVGCFMFPAE